jgi:uncharacterized protein (TIGR02449 family)
MRLLLSSIGLIMDDLLQHLEKRIHTFLQKYAHTKKMNQDLQLSTVQMAREKEHLLIKQKSAVVQIENMMTHLKSIEGLS